MERVIQITKKDSSKHIIKGVVYKPNVRDSHGDWMTPEEIEKMAYLFMKRAITNSIDTRHNFNYIHAYVCESYIVREGDPDGYPVGSWVVAIKIEDDEVWEEIESGEYAALSMAGIANADPESEPPEA